MDDLIRRRSVLDGLASIAKAKAKSDAQKAMMGRTMFFVEQLPSVSTEKTWRWIPVSERLPEEFESVLVCYKSQGGMAQAVSERFGTHTGYKWSALAGIEPIAWMPLPQPYKSQESEVDG